MKITLKANTLKIFKQRVITLLLLSIIVLINACKEEPSSIGLQLQPGNEQLDILVCDTIPIESYSYIVDSIAVSKSALTPIGSCYDPIFGVTTASVYTGFSLSSGTSGFDFGTNAVLDSLVLMLQYESYFGDTNTVLSMHAYSLTELVKYDTTYYSNTTFGFDESIDHIENNNFTPRPKTKVIIGNDTVPHPAHLRMRLKDDLGNYLMSANNNIMENIDDFQDYFKGLYLTVDKVNGVNQGSISAFNLLGDYSRLRLYFHNDADTTFYDYVVAANTGRANHFEHYDYNEADPLFKQQVLEGNQALGQQNLYLQTMSGVRTILKFPSLNKWDKLIVNDAKLVIKAEENDIFSNPDEIVINGINDDEKIYPISDFTEGAAYFGGVYNEEEKSYSFRLSKYVQKQISGSDDTTRLVLRIPSEVATGKRLVFNGSESQENKMYLQVIYTKE